MYKRIFRLIFLFFLLLQLTSQVKGQSVSFLEAVPVFAEGNQAEKNITASFRTKIMWNGSDKITLRLTAHSDYRAFVNGVFLGHGPCVSSYGFFRVDEYDLKEKLKKGDNIIAIEVAGYNIDNYYIMNQPSFLQAEITSDNKVLAATKTKNTANSQTELFEVALLNQRRKDVPKYSFQRTQMEDYHIEPTYNAWLTDMKAPFKTVPIEQTENKELIARRVKYPDYSIRKYTESLSNGVYKFECNSTGFIGLKLYAHTYAKVTLLWDEILTKGEVNSRRMWGCKNEITYKLEPGNYTLESFEPYTLKYLKVKIEEGECHIRDVYIRQYVNSDVSRASFTCNDERLNKIFKASVETYKQNALDIFMDCPSRERAGWLCDSYFMSRVAADLSGNTLIETNFIENYLLPSKFHYIPSGMLPMCYPSDHANGNYIPNWAMWFVLQLDEYAARSGDRAMIDNLKPRVLSLLNFLKKYENKNSLLEGLEKWIFIEWSKANEFTQDVNYPTNMLYARMLEVTADLYGMPELKTKAQKLKETIRTQSFDGKFFIDNAIRENGVLVPQKNNRSETCQYYAFYFNIANPDDHAELWEILLNDFGPRRKKIDAYPSVFPSNAFIGNYLRLEILARYGKVKQLINESVDEYLYMADITGTLWENTTSVASCNHGFASHIAHVFYRDLLGLNYVDRQKKQIQIVFNDTEINFCKGTIPIGDQVLIIQWEKKDGKLIYVLIKPADYKVNIINKTSLILEERKEDRNNIVK